MPEMPSLSEREQRLERVLADYLHAVDAGAPPDRDALIAHYPDLEADLRSSSAIVTPSSASPSRSKSNCRRPLVLPASLAPASPSATSGTMNS